MPGFSVEHTQVIHPSPGSSSYFEIKSGARHFQTQALCVWGCTGQVSLEGTCSHTLECSSFRQRESKRIEYRTYRTVDSSHQHFVPLFPHSTWSTSFPFVILTTRTEGSDGNIPGSLFSLKVIIRTTASLTGEYLMYCVIRLNSSLGVFPVLFTHADHIIH